MGEGRLRPTQVWSTIKRGSAAKVALARTFVCISTAYVNARRVVQVCVTCPLHFDRSGRFCAPASGRVKFCVQVDDFLSEQADLTNSDPRLCAAAS